MQGNDIEHFEAESAESCMNFCLTNDRCVAFTFDRENRFDSGNCWLKDDAANYNDYAGLTSGVRCDQKWPTDQADGEFPSELLLNYLHNSKS